jgi:hypothetical protein
MKRSRMKTMVADSQDSSDNDSENSIEEEDFSDVLYEGEDEEDYSEILSETEESDSNEGSDCDTDNESYDSDLYL